jgi:mevalonate kinase
MWVFHLADLLYILSELEMPAFTATAPGKIILFGEHAVVYGRPAIAAPVEHVRARAVVNAEPRQPPGRVHILAPDIDLDADLEELPGEHPLAKAVLIVMAELDVSRLPACTLRVTSSIPVASGLGSGAAVSVAVIRSLAAFLGKPLPPERVSALAYEVEKIHHGTPSGIDNTVITYGMPVYFVRGQAIQTLRVAVPFTVVIGDTGVESPTAVAVGAVRQGWQSDPRRYEAIFEAIAEISRQARTAIESGTPDVLGALMDDNHAYLQQMGVSSPDLDCLVNAARQAGARGAKLSGGGRGGNMIALTAPDTAQAVAQALLEGGARRTIITEVA